MTRHEILKLEGIELKCQVAAQIKAMQTAQGLTPYFSWNASDEEIRYMLGFVSDQGNGMQNRFLEELMGLMGSKCRYAGEYLWRGLLATPRQICQAFLLAQEKAE
jgi:hypothetical protein